jgi:hypothetical protein
VPRACLRCVCREGVERQGGGLKGLLARLRSVWQHRSRCGVGSTIITASWRQGFYHGRLASPAELSC